MISRRELLAAPALFQRVPARRNVLFLMADQHRADCLGPTAHTPNLDRLAREGARFVNAYSSTPTCTPARACLLEAQRAALTARAQVERMLGAAEPLV